MLRASDKANEASHNPTEWWPTGWFWSIEFCFFWMDFTAWHRRDSSASTRFSSAVKQKENMMTEVLVHLMYLHFMWYQQFDSSSLILHSLQEWACLETSEKAQRVFHVSLQCERVSACSSSPWRQSSPPRSIWCRPAASASDGETQRYLKIWRRDFGAKDAVALVHIWTCSGISSDVKWTWSDETDSGWKSAFTLPAASYLTAHKCSPFLLRNEHVGLLC